MPMIKLTTLINAPADRVFDLARSVTVHEASMQAYEEAAIAGVTSGLLDLGQRVTFRAKPLGVWQTLTSGIDALERPYHFRDRMVQGVFSRFDHDHFFVPQGQGTVMMDVFDYTSPFGLVGTLADKLFVQRTLERLLKERNRKIQEIAESAAWLTYLTPAQSSGVALPTRSGSARAAAQPSPLSNERTMRTRYALPHRLVLAIRTVVALTWLYEGLWRKLIQQDPHELAVVESVGDALPAPVSVKPLTLLKLIGLAETLLGLAVVTGRHSRLLAGAQIALLVVMNGGGVLFGKGSIEDPLALAIRNLPFAACVAALGTSADTKES